MAPRIYFDSNILIELCETGLETPPELARLFQLFEHQPYLAATSLLTLGEVLGRQAPHMEWQDQKALYGGLLVRAAFIDVIPINDKVFLDAADLRNASRLEGRSLRLADAIHIASASIASCEWFLTADIRLAKGLPAAFRSVTPSPEGIASLIQALDA